MFVPEHKHPLMSTRNRLHEFLVDDAFCAAGRPKAPLIASEKPVPGFLLALPL